MSQDEKIFANGFSFKRRDNAPEFVVGSFQDFETVYQFGQDCEVITIEIENVNLEALKKLQLEGKKVFPQPEVLPACCVEGILQGPW